MKTLFVLSSFFILPILQINCQCNGDSNDGKAETGEIKLNDDIVLITKSKDQSVTCGCPEKNHIENYPFGYYIRNDNKNKTFSVTLEIVYDLDQPNGSTSTNRSTESIKKLEPQKETYVTCGCRLSNGSGMITKINLSSVTEINE